MFPCNSPPFRPRLFQSQTLSDNLCKLYAIFLAWFKRHGVLKANFFFCKAYFVLFQMRYSATHQCKYCYKKNKRKKVVVTCHFFMSTTGVYSFFVSLNYIIATNCLMKNTQQLNAVLCIFDIVSSFVYSFPPEASELEKNMQEMKRNLSALREYSVGAFFFYHLN